MNYLICIIVLKENVTHPFKKFKMLDIFGKYIKLRGKNFIYAINNQICIVILVSPESSNII